MKRTLLPALAALLLPFAAFGQVTEGQMRAVAQDGSAIPLPLEHTDVQAEISGFVARVQVVQTFKNPFQERIEAVYVFPLPDTGAVDSMTMRIGDRVIRGEIKKREDARQIYEQAKRQGRTAALLDQERPNIFTQQVANILPGEKIDVTLTYVAPLEYDHGQYTFNFPMVVGPRYIPGTPLSGAPQGTGVAKDTTRVPDASRISPPLIPEGKRSGHDISLRVMLDAGVGLQSIASPSHDVSISRTGMRQAEVRLKETDAIPNKDFILRYDVAGAQLQAGILTHKDERGGYFTLMIQPQADFRSSEITSKEMFFVVDQSCSQSGLPMEKQKGIIYEALEKMNPGDTFNIVTFNSGVGFFRQQSVRNTPQNVAAARQFVNGLQANGGTEMLQGVVQSLEKPRDPERLRMLLFLSDGYVGNDNEIIAAVQKHVGNARMFTYGVGSSVNHHLMRRMAEAGRGYYQYARVDEDTKKSVATFYDRIAKPYLVDVQLDYGDLGVKEVYPKVIGDLFASQPIIVTGRYEGGGRGKITLKGRIANQPHVETVEVDLPRAAQPENAALASMFGRARIEDLTRQQYAGEQPQIVQAITETALTYKLMSPYTSFVAVDEVRRGGDGAPKTVVQPVEVPEGTQREAFEQPQGQSMAPPPPPAPSRYRTATKAKMAARAGEDADEAFDATYGGGRAAGVLGGVSSAPKKDAPAPAPMTATTEQEPRVTKKAEEKPAARTVFEIRDLVIRGGTATRVQVQVALRRALEEAARTLKSGTVLSGDLSMVLTLNANGTVKDVRVVHDGIGSADAVKALTDRLKAAQVQGVTSETVITLRLTAR